MQMFAMSSRQLLIIKALSLVIALLSFEIEARSVGISQSSDGAGNTLVEQDSNHYGLSGPQLAANGWATVTVNNPSVSIYTSSCQQLQKSLSSLTQDEQALLQQAKSQSRGLNSYHEASSNGYSSSRSSSSSSSSSSSFSSSSSGVISSSNGESKFTYSGPELPQAIAMLIKDNDAITFVYANNPSQAISVKPTSCLDSSEQQILQNVERAMSQMNQQYQSNMNNMHQTFDNNMQHFQNGMQQFRHQMQQMNRQMSDTFGRYHR